MQIKIIFHRIITNQILAGVITIISLGLGIFAIYDSQGASNRLEQAADKSQHRLEEISTRLTTRYLGEFPKNVPELATALEGAKTSIRVLVDHVAYAVFSDYDGYLRIQKALKTAISNDVAVEIVTFDPESQRKIAGVQFTEEEFAAIKTSDSINLKHFERNFNNNTLLKDRASFLKIIDEIENRTIQSLGNHVSFIHDEIPLYVWIIDNKTAFFSFANTDIKAEETSFRTEDRNLIIQLNVVFSEYKRRPTNSGH